MTGPGKMNLLSRPAVTSVCSQSSHSSSSLGQFFLSHTSISPIIPHLFHNYSFSLTILFSHNILISPTIPPCPHSLPPPSFVFPTSPCISHISVFFPGIPCAFHNSLFFPEFPSLSQFYFSPTILCFSHNSIFPITFVMEGLFFLGGLFF